MTTLSALGKPYPNGTTMWHRGDPEGHLYGFATKEGRDAYGRGDPGPFERVLRPLDAPPSDEELLARALCDGTVEETIEYLDALRMAIPRILTTQ